MNKEVLIEAIDLIKYAMSLKTLKCKDSACLVGAISNIEKFLDDEYKVVMEE